MNLTSKIMFIHVLLQIFHLDGLAAEGFMIHKLKCV